MRIIGGHPGLRVELRGSTVAKTAHNDDGKQYYDAAVRGLARESYGLSVMANSGYTPNLLKTTKTEVLQTYCGENEPVKTEQDFRRACVRMLYEIRKRNIRHGDLTDRNIIVRGDHPWLIDWQESHGIGQKAPQKRPQSDSALLFRCLSTWTDSTGAVDPSRVTRRWGAILRAMGTDSNLSLPLKGKTLLDLGCFQGDHAAMARAELMEAEGVDHGGFRGGEDSIHIAEELWSGMDCKFTHQNIFDLPASYFQRDVVLLFSTWAWMTQNRGGEEAKRVLRQIIAGAETLFFETQLAGDGPGPSFLPDDNYVAGMLRDCGANIVASIGSFPVPGRIAVRTVWMVRKGK